LGIQSHINTHYRLVYSAIDNTTVLLQTSVGIDLNELGGGGVSAQNV